MTLLLVRHARAGRREAWKGDDRLRPLTKRGRVQAEALVELLTPWRDAALCSSPWVRCIQSLEPLARATGAEVKVDDTLGEGMGAKAWDAMTTLTSERPVVWCTHGDVIEDILDRLGSAGADLAARHHAAKGSVWVIEGNAARYLAPPV